MSAKRSGLVDLIVALSAAGQTLTQRELADALWLSTRISPRIGADFELRAPAFAGFAES